MDSIARAVAPDIFELTGSMSGPPLNSTYRTPCWQDQSTRRLHCLPAFYVIGGFQCGVHDLGRRLSAHPNAALPANVQSAWWTSDRGYAGDFSRFVKSMDKALRKIQQHPSTAVAFTANPATLAFTWAEHKRIHMRFSDTIQACWKLCRKELKPEEFAAQCKDKTYKLDHCIKEAYQSDPASRIGPLGVEFTLPQLMVRAHGPRVRLVALLRNPTDRLWSAFFTYGQFKLKYGDGEAGVRAYFDEQSAAFERCVERYDSRRCALRLESLGQGWQEIFYHCDQLIKSMYAPFVEEWVHAFGREKLLFVRSEEYFDPARRRATLGRVVEFVGLGADEAALDAMDAVKVKRKGSYGSGHRSWQMSDETRQLIDAFYEPYNRKLGELLGDEGFTPWPVHRPSTPPGEKHRRLLAPVPAGIADAS